MKQLLLTFILVCVCALGQAQTPQLISYQAVARDLTGKVLSEKPISVQVEILQGSNQGTAVYTETHELTTTKTGTINLLIGGGNAQAGTFAEIDWSKAPYFLRLGMKQGKETGYTEVSNTQMVSVPYALYAEKAGTVVNTSNPNKDFVLTCAGDANDNIKLFTILNGGTIEGYIGGHPESYYIESDVSFTIVYLNGIDLQLTAEIEGATINTEYSSPSTPSGRCYTFDFAYYPYPEKHPLTLVIKDKENNIIASYPFTIQYNESSIQPN